MKWFILANHHCCNPHNTISYSGICVIENYILAIPDGQASCLYDILENFLRFTVFELTCEFKI